MLLPRSALNAQMCDQARAIIRAEREMLRRSTVEPVDSAPKGRWPSTFQTDHHDPTEHGLPYAAATIGLSTGRTPTGSERS